MLRSLPGCLLMLLWCSGVSAQTTLSGILLDKDTRRPLTGIWIRTDLPSETTTNADGRFTIQHAESTVIRLLVYIQREPSEYQREIPPSADYDLGQVLVTSFSTQLLDFELPTITLEDGDDQQNANISGLLQSGDDLFGRMTNFAFSPARFRRRGLESEYSEGYLNHLPVNDLESGALFWSNWGGLNDVMRLDQAVIGAEMAEWGFGGISSTFNTDLRASSQRRQTRLSYAVTNRNYRNRIMGTWSTGQTPSGWAVTLSGSRRWAQEGFVEGTFYDAWSWFASVDKKLGDRHRLNIMGMAAPYKRGGGSTSIQELYDLSGDPYYNSFWGYQQGKKRSARIYHADQPLLMLRHDFEISRQLKLTTAIGYQTGKSAIEALDWLNANDPRPDYYRRLPSYVDDPVLAEQMRSVLTSNPELLQIQWDKLYQVNLNSQFTVHNVDGVPGQSHTGALSSYIMEERRSDLDKKSGNMVLQYQVNDKSQLHVGLSATIQDMRNYKIVSDLLGGEFYIDWDKFAAQDFPGNEAAQQNDLRRPNRILQVGDQFGWDFYSRIRQQSAWLSYEVDTRHWELALAGSFKNHVYWRDGQTQNGKFPENSFGESEKNTFTLPSAKALVRYKIDGRNYVTVSGMVSELAPTFRNAYISSRTRHDVVTGLETEKLMSGEIRYDLNAPYLKMSVSGYYISSTDGIESTSFYHDDENTFVNFNLTHIDKGYSGIEAAFEYKVVPSLSVQGAAAIGQYIYTSRPTATVTQDNNGSVLQQDVTIYAKNLYVSGTPQSAYTGGLTYRSKNFWTLYLNVNYFQESWINFNPLRRTTNAVDLVEYPSQRWDDIVLQEKVDPAWTLDISFYKSWLLNWPKNRTYFALNFGISNLLNNQDYINGGYEQYRYDFDNKDPHTFPSRYSYMQGLNYFIQGSMRF